MILRFLGKDFLFTQESVYIRGQDDAIDVDMLFLDAIVDTFLPIGTGVFPGHRFGGRCVLAGGLVFLARLGILGKRVE